MASADCSAAWAEADVFRLRAGLQLQQGLIGSVECGLRSGDIGLARAAHRAAVICGGSDNGRFGLSQLLAGGAGFQQIEVGLRGCKRGIGLGQLRLRGLIIQLQQHIAGVHLGAFNHIQRLHAFGHRSDDIDLIGWNDHA